MVDTAEEYFPRTDEEGAIFEGVESGSSYHRCTGIPADGGGVKFPGRAIEEAVAARSFVPEMGMNMDGRGMSPFHSVMRGGESVG